MSQTPDPLATVTVDEAPVNAQLELRHLRATIVALRAELEAAHQAAHERVLGERTRAEEEVRQLHGTIVRLREELERTVTSGRDHVDTLERAHRAEIEQYRGTVRALREQLESATPVEARP